MSPQQTVKQRSKADQQSSQACQTEKTTQQKSQSAEEDWPGYGKETREQAQTAKRETEQLAQEGQSQAREKKESAKNQAKAAMEDGKQQLHEKTERMKADGKSLVNQQKERVADEVSSFGKAIREAADKLHEEEDQQVACYADQAADRMECLSDYLRERESTQLLHDAEDLARSKPELVYGVSSWRDWVSPGF